MTRSLTKAGPGEAVTTRMEDEARAQAQSPFASRGGPMHRRWRSGRALREAGAVRLWVMVTEYADGVVETIYSGGRTDQTKLSRDEFVAELNHRRVTS